MLKNKQKQITIQSDQLYQISLKILNNYYIEPNIQFLLLLSYLTVKEYSRHHDRLDKNAKVDLCIQYTPDLIMGLGQSKIIESTLAEELKLKFESNEKDMRNILEVYYVIFTYKNDHTMVKTKKCCFR
ncbi:MAG TPA: hypothetical protein VLG50_04965 [Candidatus Saccharimonadales bacterium]|nr:hypothetical protein [Candidatus Saccharimonadales bacterium]